MALAANHPFLNERYITAYLADSSAVTTAYAAAPFRCRVTKVQAVAGATVDSDRVVTCGIAGTAITTGAITMTASGSAAGSVFSATPTAANIANEGDYLSAASDGAGSTACPTHFVFTIVPV